MGRDKSLRDSTFLFVNMVHPPSPLFPEYLWIQPCQFPWRAEHTICLISSFPDAKAPPSDLRFHQVIPFPLHSWFHHEVFFLHFSEESILAWPASFPACFGMWVKFILSSWLICLPVPASDGSCGSGIFPGEMMDFDHLDSSPLPQGHHW